MIDLSDGLGRDAGHLVEGTGLSIELDAPAIPRNPGCDLRAALGDGEDYELLFTASGAVPESVAGTKVTRIGSVRSRGPGRPAVSIVLDGRAADASELGWEHRAGGGLA
jgi:thiamine-monophosphate kinase